MKTGVVGSCGRFARTVARRSTATDCIPIRLIPSYRPIQKNFMRISLNNVWLTNDGVADLHAWTDAHEVRLNGAQVVQEAQFLRAVSAQPLARGNRVNRVQFTVTQQHASVAGGVGVCADGVQFAARGGDGDDRVRRVWRVADHVHVRRGAGGDAVVCLSRDADGHDVRAGGRADHGAGAGHRQRGRRGGVADGLRLSAGRGRSTAAAWAMCSRRRNWTSTAGRSDPFWFSLSPFFNFKPWLKKSKFGAGSRPSARC